MATLQSGRWRVLLIFHNRSAGSGETTREELVSAFAEAGFDSRYSTKREGDPSDADGVDTIVIAGGDGTVLAAIERFADFRGRLAIVPLGGANNIATSLGILGGPREVARWLWRGRARRFRLGRLEGCGMGRAFVDSVGWGAVAQSLVAGHERKQEGDKIRGGRDVLADVLAGAEPLRSRVTVDGADLPRDALFAEILNVGITGPSLPLAPEKEPGGEAFDVAWLPAERREDFIDALLADRPLPHEVLSASRVEVTWRGDAFRIDDDFPTPENQACNLRLSRADRSVEVIVPADGIQGREQ